MSANAQATVTLSLIDRVTGPLKRLSARLGGLTRRLGLDRISRATGHLGNSLKGLASGLASTTARLSSFVALAGFGSAGAIAGLFNLSTGAAELAKEIDRLAQVAGTPALEFQKWAYAARSVGIENDKMADILKDVGDKVGDFMQTGGGPMKDFFENIAPKVGVTKKAFKDLSSADALQLYVSSLEKANLSQAELTFYMEAIANDATLLLPLLRDGGREMGRLGEEAEKAGGLLSDAAVKLGKEFTQNYNAIFRRLDALKTLVGVQLLPVFNEFVIKLRELYDANVDLIRAKLIDWAGRLRKVLRDLMDPASELRIKIAEMAASFSGFIDTVAPFVDFIGGPLYAGLALVTAWIVGPLVVALASLSAAFINLGIVMMTTPFGWIVAGVAAVAASVYVLYQKWDEFLAYWGNLWGRIREGFAQGFIHGVIALLKEFNPVTHIARGINAVIEYFTGIDLMEHGSRLIQSLTAGISAEAQQLGADITAAIEQGWATFDAWWDGFSEKVRAAGAAIVQALWDGLKAQWASVVEWMKSAVADLVGWLPESIRSKLGFDINATVSGPGAAANDNAAAAGAAVGRMGGAALYGVPTGASQTAAGVPANDNAGTAAAGDVENNILTNAGNTITTTTNATIHITAPPGADAAAIGAAVRKELDSANRKAAAASQSRLSD